MRTEFGEWKKKKKEKRSENGKKKDSIRYKQ